jgi:hypothetical protein
MWRKTMPIFVEEIKRGAPFSAPKPKAARQSVPAQKPAAKGNNAPAATPTAVRDTTTATNQSSAPTPVATATAAAAPARGFAPPRIAALALALVLALALTFAFAGCDSAGDSDAGSSSAGADDSSAPGVSTRAAGGDTGSNSDAGGADTGTGTGADASDPASSEAPPPENAAPTANAEAIDAGGALTFDAAKITGQATFFPLTVDGTYMEVIAVRAPDDTVRTAFNTCQVCWDSGRGYYIQESDEFVCQNCGNRFNVSDVEVVRGGCNPVPIEAEYKTVEGDSIAIGYDILKEAVPLFADWKY